MKKIFTALVAVGMLFSCSSKENAEPKLQPSNQGSEDTPAIKAVDPNTPGAVRLSLSADIEPFEVTGGGFASEGDSQSARATEVTVAGPDVNKAISYRLTADADGKVPVLICLYDDNGIGYVTGDAEVTNNGQGVKIKLGVFCEPSSSADGHLKRIIDNKMKDAKLAFIIGHDATMSGGNYVFTNKGPRLLKYQTGKKNILGGNFIMLKATDIPLKYDEASKTITPTKKVKLNMQGYLIGARFRNLFPRKIYKYKWRNHTENPYAVDIRGNKTLDVSRAAQVDRPPLDVVFRIDNLSATYQTKITYNRIRGMFAVGVDLAQTQPNILNYRVTTPGLSRNGKPLVGNGSHEFFLDAVEIGNKGVIKVPVGSAPNNNTFAENEEFVLVYCPNPYDTGSIAYKSPYKLFYDGSPFSQMRVKITTTNFRVQYLALANEENAFKKRAGVVSDNKFYFVVFPIEARNMDRGSESYTKMPKSTTFGRYRNYLK